MKILCIILFLVSWIPAYGGNNKALKLVNTSHLDKLYEEINIDGKEMGIVHIYSNYPDYNWADAPGEGIACVDDASRAMIFYLRNYQVTGDKQNLVKTKMLLEFLFHMQSDNGTFFNFIFDDHSINKTGNTSRNVPDWWTWRGLWAMAEAYRYFYKEDSELRQRLEASLKKGFKSIDSILADYPSTTTYLDRKLPAWLPYKYASDQATVIVLALLPFYEIKKEDVYADYINKLCEGIILMQAGNQSAFPYYAFLSWENLWHGWGSNQSEALLRAGMLLNNKKFIESAIKEVDNFYPYVIDQNYFNEFRVQGNSRESFTKYPQIAYGINPMVQASLLAFKITKDPKYFFRARKIFNWFWGSNAAGDTIYDLKSGRCYDGITSDSKINLNSGAESTIEALLAAQSIEISAEQKSIYFKKMMKKLNSLKF